MPDHDFEKTILVRIPEGASKAEEDRLVNRAADREAEKLAEKLLKDFGF